MNRIKIILLTLVLLASCEDVNYRSSVPTTPVNYTLYITREHPHFLVENGFQTMTITQRTFTEDYIGYSGLLIWIGMDNAYHAADLCCPHYVKKHKPLDIDGLYACCSLCGERYDISYGYGVPTKGITKEPLKLYNTSYRNLATGAQLHIFN